MPAKRTKSPARPGGVTSKPLTPPSPKKKSPRRSKRSPARTQSSPAERRSPARTKSPARRPRSPARIEKSPARIEKSPARIEKSPARIEKSPARTEKSPARHTEKSPARRTEKSPKSAKRSPKKKSPARKPETPSKLSTEFISRREEIFLNEPKVLLVNHDRGDGYKLGDVYRASREMSTSSFTIRRSTRIIPRRESAEPEQRKYEDRKVIEQVSVSDDEEEWEKPIKEASKPSKEFGGILGTLLLPILFQVTFLASHVYTSKAQYGIKDFKIPTNWRTYFDIEVAAIFLGFIVLQLILTILPIGKLVDGMPGKSGRLRYRCNGFFSTVVTMAILGGLRHFQFPVLVVLDKYFQFFVTSLIYGYIFGVILYIKGLRAPVISQNPHAVTGNHIYDFYMGREINPRIGPFDIKIGLLRVGLIGLVVVNAAFILKNVQQSGGYSPTLLVCAGLQIWYALDALWFEETFLSSFEIMYEGMGYMLTMGYCAYPFIPTLITRMIHNYRLEIPVYALVIISVIHAIGYVIFRRSNSQKSEFRKNPLNPALAHLETIPTTRGKKLLVSGWWGFVRHPNYLGDIIMHWAWASTTGFAHPLPYVVVPLFITVLLATRTLRDDARCRQRYQGAWDRYCNRVKYRLVPKVF